LGRAILKRFCDSSGPKSLLLSSIVRKRVTMLSREERPVLAKNQREYLDFSTIYLVAKSDLLEDGIIIRGVSLNRY
jgi:hypothetical protein